MTAFLKSILGYFCHKLEGYFDSSADSLTGRSHQKWAQIVTEMPCGLQVALSDVKRQPSCLHWAHVDLTYMGGLFAANPALGHRSSWSRFSIGMGLSYCSRLAFWFTLLTLLPIQTGTARVSSSLSTTHHVHHFHNKHGTVPIAINRMPFLTRGGHGKTFPSNSLNLQVCCLANALFRCG